MLVGAASGIRKAVGIAVHPVDLPHRQALLADLRGQLGDTQFERASSKGATDLLPQFMRTGYVQLETGAETSL